VLGLEGLGLSSKGLGSESAASRMVDIRYASGHLSPDIDLSSSPEEQDGQERDEEPKWVQAKRRRVHFWRRLLADKMGKISGGDPRAGMARHPRIVSVANHIERISWAGQDGGSPLGEKVLVFGVFNAPLRGLHDMLNRRAVLRLLDRGIPVPGGVKLANKPDGIWQEYQAITTQLSSGQAGSGALLPLAFSGKLAERLGTPDDLVALLKEEGRRYENLRDGLSSTIDLAFLKTLPGDAAIDELGEPTRRDLCQLLRTRIVNAWLLSGGSASDPGGGTKNAPRSRQARDLALQIWSDYLLCHVETGDQDGSVEAVTPWKSDKVRNEEEERKLRKLDRLGDNISPGLLEKLIAHEAAHGSGPFSAFARIMSGQVRMETRHVLQQQFNQLGGFPRVLIAQSQVGREGLNLHKACRRVILFHSEWNPAIIEQQIGRVDRISSLWEEMAKRWRRSGSGQTDEMPKILIEHVVFEGTYDEYQAGVFEARQRNMQAHLFGQLLDSRTTAELPEDLCRRLQQAAPDFSPTTFILDDSLQHGSSIRRRSGR